MHNSTKAGLAIRKWLRTLDDDKDYQENLDTADSSIALESLATPVIKASGNLQLDDLQRCIEEAFSCKCGH